MRAITPDTRSIELDVTEAPEIYRVNSLDGDGGLLDLLEEYSDSDAAHAAAKKLAHDSHLPLSIRDDIT